MLHENLDQISPALNTMGVPVHVIDAQELQEALANLPVTLWVGQIPLDASLIHPDDMPHILAQWSAAQASGGDLAIQYRLRVSDGSYHRVLMRASVLRDVHENGGENINRRIGTTIDIEAMLQSHEQLQKSEFCFRQLAEYVADAFFLHDASGRFLDVNQSACSALGYTREELLQRNIWDISVHFEKATLQTAMAESVSGQSFTIRDEHRRRDSSLFSVEIHGGCFEIDGQKLFLDVARDITEREAAREQIEFLAFHDPLTRLPNRVLLRDRFEQVRACAERAHSKVALLSLDLDHFKTINDALGHTIGDALLKNVADRFCASVRSNDTVSRQGGDEFTVLLTDLHSTENIVSLASRVCDSLIQPLDINGRDLPISVSIGLAVYPDDGDDFDTLFNKADTAMYCAKQEGRNTFRFFNPEMAADADARLYLTKDLRRAQERGELLLHYQPQIDLASGALVGAEALLRWRHPELGLLPPGLFIPIAEDTGLIVPIGAWVLREACRQAVVWQQAGLPHITIAVNLSAVQFRQGNLEQTVFNALAETGLNPACLELELTESILIRDTEAVLQTVQRIKAHGVKFSIDDFGTGYSSLSYLKRFAVDKLKIDKSFISNMTENSDDAAIALTIIHLAHSLKLRTIAEGVEDAQVLEFLRGLNCDEAQGYHIARPMAAEHFAAYVVAQP